MLLFGDPVQCSPVTYLGLCAMRYIAIWQRRTAAVRYVKGHYVPHLTPNLEPKGSGSGSGSSSISFLGGGNRVRFRVRGPRQEGGGVSGSGSIFFLGVRVRVRVRVRAGFLMWRAHCKSSACIHLGSHMPNSRGAISS